MRRGRAASAALAAVLCLGSARAGLFDDDEARKAILDLRSRITQNDEQAKARAGDQAAANAQMAEQLAALRRSLLELANQIEAMRAEQASLRGSNEQLTRSVSELQARQKDVGQAIDDRLRKLEPVKVALDGDEFLADPDEKRAHDDAMAALRGGDFDRAAIMLSTFLRRYPASGFAPSVRFWLGNALYGKRDYKDAIATFRAFAAASPSHPRAPEAMLGLANSLAETRDIKGARKTIDDLIKAYPQSEAAQAGRERLAALK